MAREKTVFIVGAGFSANAGLPLQSDFTKLLLKAHTFTKGKSRHLMPQLDSFVESAFGFLKDQDVSLYPELEDIFTMIDLSANSGHHLGPDFPPRKLRALRRALLSRIIRMLNSAYLDGKKKPTKNRELLLDLLGKVSPEKHQFVSLNWDVVVEGCLEELDTPGSPFYSEEIQPATIGHDSVVVPVPVSKKATFLHKVHGSINWLYCDCCRRTYSVPVKEVPLLASQVLNNSEAKRLYGESSRPRLKCPSCTAELSVRLATFSYQKALRTPMFESSWLEAEKDLRVAAKWVFLGYSLPAADFEFKYLLKRVELARNTPPIIQVVTKRDPNCEGDSLTMKRYKRFFGETRVEFFPDGLTPTVIRKIL